MLEGVRGNYRPRLLPGQPHTLTESPAVMPPLRPSPSSHTLPRGTSSSSSSFPTATVPDAPKTEQDDVVLDRDGGRRLVDVDGGVDAAQVARLQAVLLQQVASPRKHLPRATGAVQPQHLHACTHGSYVPLTGGGRCSHPTIHRQCGMAIQCTQQGLCRSRVRGYR